MQTLDDRVEGLAFAPPSGQWQALEGERDRLRLLLEVSESIASNRDITELLKDLAQRLPRVVPFDVINLVLYDPERDTLRLHALVAPECNKSRNSRDNSIRVSARPSNPRCAPRTAGFQARTEPPNGWACAIPLWNFASRNWA